MAGWIERSIRWCEVDLQRSSGIGVVRWLMVLAQVVLRGVATSDVAMRCFVAVKREAIVWGSQKEWNNVKEEKNANVK